MGDEVLVVLKVYPEGPDEVEAADAGLKEVKAGTLKDSKREPLAFGLELIKAAFTIKDKQEGALEALLEEIKAVEGVKDVEVEATTLL